MPAVNPVREALSSGRFCYMVKLVASRLTREAKLMQVASELAQIPNVVAGSITSYAGGAMGTIPSAWEPRRAREGWSPTFT
jgi:hypothetical protein